MAFWSKECNFAATWRIALRVWLLIGADLEAYVNLQPTSLLVLEVNMDWFLQYLNELNKLNIRRALAHDEC